MIQFTMIARQRSAHRCTQHAVPGSRRSNSFSHFAFLPMFRQLLPESHLSVPPFTNRKSGGNQARRQDGNRPSQPAWVGLQVFCRKISQFCDCRKTSRSRERELRANEKKNQKISQFVGGISSKGIEWIAQDYKERFVGAACSWVIKVLSKI